MSKLPKNARWFYTVSWYEGSIFKIETVYTTSEAIELYKQIKSIIWQTKAKDLRVTRYGEFVFDFTSIVEAELSSEPKC